MSAASACRITCSFLLLALVAAQPSRPDAPPPAPIPWGFAGHEMGARAAASILPVVVPTFFRDAREQLAWLNPEPDRWRDRNAPEMARAWEFDHYVDLENLPPGALDAPDRFTYLARLYAAGLDRPQQEGGFLYYRIVELYQRLTSSWAAWHAAAGDPRRQGWIEERIISDAGLLGHYVMDASQPHHTTIHFNGWDSATPNPEGFTSDRDMHSRFERYFVDAHVDGTSIRERMPGQPDTLPTIEEVRAAVRRHIQRAHDEVETLYRLDRDVGFEAGAPPAPEAVDFTIDRLVDGSTMLADLWWSAWIAGSEAAPN